MFHHSTAGTLPLERFHGEWNRDSPGLTLVIHRAPVWWSRRQRWGGVGGSRSRGQSYSQDLRERVLAAVDSGMAVAEAAALFRVSVSYIYKVRLRRRRTGETTARLQRCHLVRKLSVHHEVISAEVAARPDLTLAELRVWLSEEHGVTTSVGGLWNTLERLGLTLKKRRGMPPNRSAPTLPPPATPGDSSSRP